MAMDPQKKSRLAAYTQLAQAIIFNKDRAKALISMASSPDGVMNAVKTVIAGIEQKKPVPPDLAPLLAVNIYMVLTDLAREVSGQKPNPQAVLQTIKQLMVGFGKAYNGKPKQPAQPPQQQQPQQPNGLLAQGAM